MKKNTEPIAWTLVGILAFILVVLMLGTQSYSGSMNKLSNSGTVKIVNKILIYEPGNDTWERKELQALLKMSEVYKIEIITPPF